MKVFEFNKYFPDEATCRRSFKELMHKLRSVMGKRDDKYTLKGCIELDEGFFSTEIPKEKKNEKLKAGAGSQRKSKVMVIAESTPAAISAKTCLTVLL